MVYLGHALVENRNVLIAAAMAATADGYAERKAALLMLEQKPETDLGASRWARKSLRHKGLCKDRTPDKDHRARDEER